MAANHKLEDLQDRALRALADGENGAALRVLEVLMQLVLAGEEIRPNFQKIANAIVAQSVLLEKLPSKPKGRPKDQGDDDITAAAWHYYDLRDAGVKSDDAVAEVAARFHKNERHIMRLVERGKQRIGSTRAERDNRREWNRFLLQNMDVVMQRHREMHEIFAVADEREMQRDYIGELDDLIAAELMRCGLTDKKSP